MSEREHHLEIPIGSERSFGIVFAAVFLIVALWPLLGGSHVRIWSLGVSAVFLFAAFLTPRLLSVPNRLWFKFGTKLGAVVAPVVMALVFFVTVVPIGIVMRLIGKDLLQRKIVKTADTYWTERQEPVGSMKNQY